MSAHHESAARGPDARMVDRLLFFSDAVFAIVLTLLILDLRPPSLAGIYGRDAWSAILRVEPHFFSFALSFGIVSMWWALHMRVTRNLARFDVAMAIFNLVFLFAITLVPFAAGLIGQSGWNSPEAFVVYWIVNMAASLSMALMSVLATRGRGKFLATPLSFGARVFIIYQNFVPVIVFCASTWLALRGQIAASAMATAATPPLIVIARIFYRKPKAA